MLQESGLRPERLELEISEAFIMGGSEQHVAVLNRLKALGVGLSIDDFGSGYSSFSYLQRLPIDRLKLNRAFLNGVPSNTANSAIAGAVVALGEKFGIPVVAGGIEAVEQRLFAREIGCRTGQGFLYGKALPPDQFRKQMLL
jgi:EAL domain-containing protein (putative c-di-GMP-specific phosphodiesterase class I)